ncbi:MAG: ABC transporter permease [Oscillospiraceae bacterium]
MEKSKTSKMKSRSRTATIFAQYLNNKMAVFCLAIIGMLILMAIFVPTFSKYSYTDVDYTALYATPSTEHWLGCDAAGRDMLMLLCYSLRNALIVGAGACAVQLMIGLILGGISGYCGGKIDNILSRIIDIMYGFPTFLFNLILVLLLGRSLFTIFLAIGLTSWAPMARLVRSQVITVKQSDYVEAGRAIGASHLRILFRYILPNCLGPIVICLSQGIPAAMFAESGMSLIGLGVLPPMPSWGGLIQSGQQFILSYPHMIIYPALSFAITILAFSYVGDGLRDAFDPRQIQ